MAPLTVLDPVLLPLSVNVPAEEAPVTVSPIIRTPLLEVALLVKL